MFANKKYSFGSTLLFVFQAVGDSVKKESGKDFMLDAKYGFIHACPTNLGTGKFTPSFFTHCKEPIPKNSKQIFPEKELRVHSPNFHIHVSVSDLNIPMIDLPILMQEICGQILGIYKSLADT